MVSWFVRQPPSACRPLYILWDPGVVVECIVVFFALRRLPISQVPLSRLPAGGSLALVV